MANSTRVKNDRATLKGAIDHVFKQNHIEKERLINEKPEGWMQEVDRLDEDTFSRLRELKESGILKTLNLFHNKELIPQKVLKGDKSAISYGKYQLAIENRELGYVVTLFSWPPETETPIHEHPLRCNATGYAPPKLKNVATTIEITFKEEVTGERKPALFKNMPPNMPSTRRPKTASELMSDSEPDEHAVYNPLRSAGDPKKDLAEGRYGFSVHTYLIKGITHDKDGASSFVDYSNMDFPPTAQNFVFRDGFVDPKTQNIRHQNGKENYALIPYSEVTVANLVKPTISPSTTKPV